MQKCLQALGTRPDADDSMQIFNCNLHDKNNIIDMLNKFFTT